jgi:hypothetical protein
MSVVMERELGEVPTCTYRQDFFFPEGEYRPEIGSLDKHRSRLLTSLMKTLSVVFGLW